MDYEKKYKEALERAKMYQGMVVLPAESMIETIFPELAESEDELTWLTKYIEEEAYSLSMDIRDNEDRIKLKKLQKALAWLEKQGEPLDKGEISDGYHTFNELYYYRMLYNAAFFNLLPKEWVHKSKKHHTGEECFGGGWFIVMANLPTGQISNHYELKDWDLFQIPEKEVADKWDGHTPQEAADRLHKYLLEKQGKQKPTTIDIDKMVDDYANNKERGNEEFGKPVNCMIRAYRQGLKDAIGKVVLKPTWSEEDEKIQNTTISFLSEYAAKGYENAVMCIDWLKSLKQRIGWKPSEEQMKALDSVIDEYDGYPEFDSLVSLKNDLKKL